MFEAPNLGHSQIFLVSFVCNAKGTKHRFDPPTPQNKSKKEQTKPWSEPSLGHGFVFSLCFGGSKIGWENTFSYSIKCIYLELHTCLKAKCLPACGCILDAHDLTANNCLAPANYSFKTITWLHCRYYCRCFYLKRSV